MVQKLEVNNHKKLEVIKTLFGSISMGLIIELILKPIVIHVNEKVKYLFRPFSFYIVKNWYEFRIDGSTPNGITYEIVSLCLRIKAKNNLNSEKFIDNIKIKIIPENNLPIQTNTIEYPKKEFCSGIPLQEIKLNPKGEKILYFKLSFKINREKPQYLIERLKRFPKLKFKLYYSVDKNEISQYLGSLDFKREFAKMYKKTLQITLQRHINKELKNELKKWIKELEEIIKAN